MGKYNNTKARMVEQIEQYEIVWLCDICGKENIQTTQMKPPYTTMCEVCKVPTKVHPCDT